jgi:hypothetical protein
MRTTQQMSITLPDDMAKLGEFRVWCGEVSTPAQVK